MTDHRDKQTYPRGRSSSGESRISNQEVDEIDTDRHSKADRKLLRGCLQFLALLPTLGTLFLLVGYLSLAIKAAKADLPWRVTLEALSFRVLVSEGALLLTFSVVFLAVGLMVLLAIGYAIDQSVSRWRKRKGRKKESREQSQTPHDLDSLFEAARRHPVRTWLSAAILFGLFAAGLFLAPVTWFVGAVALGLCALIVIYSLANKNPPGEPQAIPWTMLGALLFLWCVGVGLWGSGVGPVRIPEGTFVGHEESRETPCLGVLSMSASTATVVVPGTDPTCVCPDEPHRENKVRVIESSKIQVGNENFELDGDQPPSLFEWFKGQIS